jgi:hypothetical protein
MVLLRDGFQQVCWDKTLFFFEISSLPQLDDRSVFQRTNGMLVEQIQGKRVSADHDLTSLCA